MQKLVCLHGALGSSNMFEDLMNLLKNDYDCTAIDLPQHGNNATSSDFTIEAFTQYFIQYIEQHYTEKIFVFGYSMGGYIALYAACLKPDLFHGVMTFETKYSWNANIAAKERRMLNTEKMQEKIPAFVEALKQRHRCLDWETMVNQTANLLEQLGQHPPLNEERLSTLQAKIYIGGGDQSNMITTEETCLLAKHIPSAACFILPNTQHAFESVDLAVLVVIIRQWIQGYP